MNAKESLLTEIEAIPESLIPEVLNYVQYIKYKHQLILDHTEETLTRFSNQNEQLETTILSESLLASDWLTPEEDEAWQHL
ncbi:MAG: hypothetical protein RLZZ574_3141 [Cyanobacteriota bacterium]|jgi:hypothetical protein